MKLLQLLSVCNVCSIHTKIINNNTDKIIFDGRASFIRDYLKAYKFSAIKEDVIMRTYKVSFIAVNNNTLYIYLDK